MTLQQLRARITQIEAEYGQKYAALFSDDEQQYPRFPEAEHKERLFNQRTERNRKLTEVQEAVKQAVAEAQEELARFARMDPTTLLSSAELSEAAAMKAFADDAVRALPIAQLRDRLQDVLAGGNRPTLFAYLHSARMRNADLGDRALDAVLAEMHARLAGPDRLAKVEQAKAVIAEAMDVELRAAYAKRGARNAAGFWAAKRGLRSVG